MKKKKKHICISSNEVDEHQAYHAECSKSERETQTLYAAAAAAKSLQSCLTLCHLLLQHVKVKSESEVAKSCSTLRDPKNYSLPGSSVHGIFQTRVLEWVAMFFSTNTVY